MARKEIKTYIVTDDLTGEEIPDTDAVTIQFSYGGQAYEIDLSKNNAKKLDDFMADYIDKARRVRSSSAAPVRRTATKRQDLNAVRKWAKANGHSVSERGRVAQAVLDAYEAEH
ncbi:MULTISPECIES: histone-like nucleoid-structuring protein Lsr2 [unclassified Microbacterium]|uniref:histone-like nucleoid-structuring protein Lsr2 n=1 Tax=unclassified Microbacterium TaxID=2609290 RepID=UPI00301670B7